jgi:hypothetical protein
MRSYHIDEQATDLEALQDRLQSTDLIPSQRPLLDGLAEKSTSIRKSGVASLADLRRALKTEQSLTSFSEISGVDVSYLRLLKRAINGFTPKSRPLKAFDWLDAEIVKKLNDAGIRNTRHIFEATGGVAAELARSAGISRQVALDLLSISDLCRIQWVSPSFARALVEVGAATAADVAAANPEALFEALKTANCNARFYKGTVGLRDIKRLVTAARYVP